jgi:hypothetical protein
MEVDVEIKNATSSIGTVTIQVRYERGFGLGICGLGECTTPIPLDSLDTGTFTIDLNSLVNNKTSIRFKKWGPQTGTGDNPILPGSDWTGLATVEIVKGGTSIFDSEGHKYCLTYDSIEIDGDENPINPSCD